MPILAPFEAFARDAEVLKVKEHESRLLVRWLAAAQIAGRFADSHERKSVLRVWMHEQSVDQPSGVWAAVTVPGIRVTDISSASAALCHIAADMERGGALNLAYTTVTSMRIAMLERGPAAARAAATLQQARVLRQMGLLDEAKDTYEEAHEDAIRAGDRELEGRALQGLGVVAGHRGNFPEVVKYATRALDALPEHSPFAALVHGDLMIAAKTMNDFTTAFEHGWRAYDAAGTDVERRAGIICNLGSLALRCGRFTAARRGFIAALNLTTLERIQLPALGGVALVSAATNDTRELARVSSMLDRASASAALHYELAQARFELAQAWQEIGDLQKAEEYLARARQLAGLYGFHEVSFRSELLSQAIETSRVRSARNERLEAAIARFDGVSADADVLAHV